MRAWLEKYGSFQRFREQRRYGTGPAVDRSLGTRVRFELDVGADVAEMCIIDELGRRKGDLSAR
jgi:hypothetical protein